MNQVIMNRDISISTSILKVIIQIWDL